MPSVRKINTRLQSPTVLTTFYKKNTSGQSCSGMRSFEENFSYNFFKFQSFETLLHRYKVDRVRQCQWKSGKNEISTLAF